MKEAAELTISNICGFCVMLEDNDQAPARWNGNGSQIHSSLILHALYLRGKGSQPRAAGCPWGRKASQPKF